MVMMAGVRHIVVSYWLILDYNRIWILKLIGILFDFDNFIFMRAYFRKSILILNLITSIIAIDDLARNFDHGDLNHDLVTLLKLV